MNRFAWPVFLSLCSTAAYSQDDAPPTNFDEYQEKHQYVCNGPLEWFATPDVREYGGFTYAHTGSTVKVTRATPKKGPIRFGVLSAIKDNDAQTLAVVKTFLDRFEQQDVDFVVVGGDTGEEPSVLEKFYEWLAQQTKRPVLTVPGNSERPAAHNYAVLKQRKAGALNLLTLNMIRRVDGAGADVVGLGGYYNKDFLHMRGACVYKAEDVAAVVAAAKASDDPVVLLVHGPPKQQGKDAIDFVPGDGNVGDPQLADAIKEAKIPFGIHGHILEAGGKATDLAGKPIKPNKHSRALFLNPGSANPLPWRLNAGGTSWGLAAILTVDGKNAKYEVLRAPKPKDE